MCGTQTIHTTTTRPEKGKVGIFLFDCGIVRSDVDGIYFEFFEWSLWKSAGRLVTCRTVVGLQWGQ